MTTPRSYAFTNVTFLPGGCDATVRATLPAGERRGIYPRGAAKTGLETDGKPCAGYTRPTNTLIAESFERRPSRDDINDTAVSILFPALAPGRSREGLPRSVARNLKDKGSRENLK